MSCEMIKSVELIEKTAGSSLSMSTPSEERINVHATLSQAAGKGTESEGKGIARDDIFSKRKSKGASEVS